MLIMNSYKRQPPDNYCTVPKGKKNWTTTKNKQQLQFYLRQFQVILSNFNFTHSIFSPQLLFLKPQVQRTNGHSSGQESHSDDR